MSGHVATRTRSFRSLARCFRSVPGTLGIGLASGRGRSPHLAAALAVAATGWAGAPACAGAQTSVVARGVAIPAAAPGLAAFASSVVVQEGTVYVGKPGGIGFFPMPPNRPGAVHVFERSDGEWTETAVVEAPGGDVGTGFGEGLDVHGGVMVVGAPSEGNGAVHVYRRADGQWSAEARLTWSDAVSGARFGAAVASDGGSVFAGAPGADGGAGAVVAFDRDAEGRWRQVATFPGEVPAGQLGLALDMEGGLAAAGAPGGDPPLIPSGEMPAFLPGAVHIFARDESGEWTRAATLEPPAATPAATGRSVAVSGGRVFAGAPFAAHAAGAVYEFARSDEGPPSDAEWTLVRTIEADEAAFGTLMGMSISASGSDLVAGTPLAGQGLGGGTAFRRDAEGEWRQVASFGPGGPFAFYGMAVAVGGDVAVAGAPGADFFEGTGFLFRRTAEGWEPEGSVIDEAGGLEAVTGEERECQDGSAAAFDCEEVDLVSFVPVRGLGGERGVVVNDLWGWTDPETGKEYAVVGRNNATTFVDLSDPGNPIYLGELPLTEGATPNMWRDIKVFADHAFIVADQAGPHGVQVFDLTRLRDVTAPPVVFEADAHYDGIHSAHNIVVNEGTGFAYVVGASGGGETCGGGLHMIDVREPKNPTFAGCFADGNTGNAGTGYSHDAQCIRYHGPDPDYQDREICLGANENALSISDVTDKDAPVALSTAEYPNTGYLHQGWVTDDHRYFFMNDEIDELAGNVSRTRTLVWDIADLEDPVLVKEHFGSTGSSDHNLYVRGDYMYQANYVSGLRILDISEPEEPKEVGFFDTVSAGDDVPGFAGAWSVYPYFESGLIIVSSMREGLFVLRKRPPPVS